MAFGTTNTTKTAENNLGGLSNQAFQNSGTDLAAGKQALGAGQGILNSGAGTTQAGTNFFNTLLNGNQANTTALLQPNIQQIRNSDQNAIQAASTLMPRGGGRSSTLFQQPFMNNQQIGGLYNTARSGAAGQLAQIGQGQQQIGLGQQGIGANLFSTANQPLQTVGSANAALGGLGQNQQQITNSLWSNLGAGLFGLATLPLTGGGSLLGTALGKLTGLGGSAPPPVSTGGNWDPLGG